MVEPAERMVAKPRRDSSGLLGQRSWDPPSPMPPMLCKGVQAQVFREVEPEPHKRIRRDEMGDETQQVMRHDQKQVVLER